MEYQKKHKEKEKKIPAQEREEGKECPNCHSINDAEAKFCAECGYDFTSGRRCPKCGAKIISPNADICEVCGEWLLEGKCKFCYADLEEGAIYCAECGNPVAGIVCPRCGKLSYFDFCKHCNTPLTTVAQKMIEKVKKSPNEQIEKFSSNQEARAYYMAQKFLIMNQQTEAFESKDVEELRKMKEYIEKVEKKERKCKTCTPLFTNEQIKSIKSLDKDAEEELKRQEEERKRKEEEERKRLEEERKRRTPRGWICNRYGVLHPGGPCECSAPEFGGYWVY